MLPGFARLRAFASIGGVLAAGFVGMPHEVSAIEGSLEAVSTTIAVRLDDRLSSQDNKTGDTFAFELTGSVMLDGVPVGAGTRGHGIVIDARSGAGPRHGALTLQARTIELADGRQIPVGLARGSLDRTLGRESRGLYVPLGGAVPVYVGSSRDNNVVYEKGTPFQVIAPPPETPDPSASP